MLERLNSVLEPGRSLMLAERGGAGAELIVAHPAFRLVATMNPGTLMQFQVKYLLLPSAALLLFLPCYLSQAVTMARRSCPQHLPTASPPSG